MRKLLSPLNWIYRSAVQGKNALFDLEVIKSVTLDIPVISIGNLSVGGTGKTPMCIWISEELKKSNRNVALVARGYGVSLNGPQEVKSLESGRFGDEPVLMKSKLDVPVFVGPKKNETAKMVSDLKKVDVIVVDDGFQHRKLSRDLDIVLVDTTMEPELFTLLPSGNLREPIENLARADVVVLTKCNLSENLEWYRKTVAQYSELVLESDFEVSLPKKRAFPVGPKVVCVSGIGNPRQFEESVKKLLKPSKIQTIRFPDHHRFTDADIRRIQRAVSGKETLCVTTEKDQIRLPEMGIDWVVPQAQFKWRKNAETEFEKLLKSRILDRQKRK